jgi:hypothetical protein
MWVLTVFSETLDGAPASQNAGALAALSRPIRSRDS